jgi:hypothetical protein
MDAVVSADGVHFLLRAVPERFRGLASGSPVDHLWGSAPMSTGLPTIWELVAEGAATLPEPFSRAALINWIHARRPDVGVPSISKHIQLATANAAHPDDCNRAPLLHRVGRGTYVRYREPSTHRHDVTVAARVVLIGSSGATASGPVRVGDLFQSAGFARAREHAVHSRLPWFVLSAKHGLLEPDDVVAPYDLQLGDASTVYRSAWGEWVAAQLGERVQLAGATVEVHGGVDFAQPLRQPLARRGAALELPLPGTWQEAAHGEPIGHAEEAGSPEGALSRLRSLMARSRSADSPQHGHDASAS